MLGTEAKGGDMPRSSIELRQRRWKMERFQKEGPKLFLLSFAENVKGRLLLLLMSTKVNTYS